MLMRFDPFRELDSISQMLSRQGASRTLVMPMDAYRAGDRFIVHLDVPGVDPASIDLTVEKNVLTIKAQRTWQPPDGTDVVIAERPRGTFTRQLFLGESLDSERVEAAYENGVLTLRIPVAEHTKPRKVTVAGGEGAPSQIPATASAGSSGDGGS